MAWDAQGRWIPDTLAPGAQGVQGSIVSPVAAVPRDLPPVTRPPPHLPPTMPPTGGAPPPMPPGPAPAPAPGAMPSAMPPTPAVDTSTSGQLTGLLAQNSPYLQQARAGGIRTAARRGLLNSSIAAGSGEAAAIAAAAPIASQDAQQLAQTAQTRLEGDINFNNSSRLQTQQSASQMDLQRLSDTGAMSRQTAAAADELKRLGITIAAQANTATADHTNQLTIAQIQSNHNLISSYLGAFGEMSKNADLPAAARNAYVGEMQTVISQSMALTTSLANRQIAWGV